MADLGREPWQAGHSTTTGFWNSLGLGVWGPSVSTRRYVSAYEGAHAYVKLGHKKQAFEWLEKGKQDRADCMVWRLSEPGWTRCAAIRGTRS
jgi:hypothetical protein